MKLILILPILLANGCVLETGGSSGEAGLSGLDGGGSGLGDASPSESAPDAGGCPPGMVQIQSYCIDVTEVTRLQYAAWLATNPLSSEQSAECNWNTDFAPSCEWPVGTRGQHPVVCVDWCDAYAYCHRVSKRLCGKIGGGENDFADFADPSKSQWFNACSAGGTLAYPYGSSYDPAACNGADKGIGSTIVTGNLASCQGGFPGLFDMSGNVWEWEDSCDGTGKCRVRGGSFADPDTSEAHRCAYDYAFGNNTRDASFNSLGFRCCLD